MMSSSAPLATCGICERAFAPTLVQAARARNGSAVYCSPACAATGMERRLTARHARERAQRLQQAPERAAKRAAFRAGRPAPAPRVRAPAVAGVIPHYDDDPAACADYGSPRGATPRGQDLTVWGGAASSLVR